MYIKLTKEQQQMMISDIQEFFSLERDEEISEFAESCVALALTQGQAIDLILSEMSVNAGGFLLPEDTPKVRIRAEVLIAGRSNIIPGVVNVT